MSVAPEIAEVTNINIIPCLETVANLQTWTSSSARKMLGTVTRYMVDNVTLFKVVCIDSDAYIHIVLTGFEFLLLKLN